MKVSITAIAACGAVPLMMTLITFKIYDNNIKNIQIVIIIIINTII
jgi:hypothetical protein